MIAAMNRHFCKPSGLFFFLPYFFWRKKSNKKSTEKIMLSPRSQKSMQIMQSSVENICRLFCFLLFALTSMQQNTFCQIFPTKDIPPIMLAGRPLCRFAMLF